MAAVRVGVRDGHELVRRQPGGRFKGNPAWGVPTEQTSLWMRKVEYDGEEDQRRFDEYELDHPSLVTRSWWGGEKQVDSRGRERKDPKKYKPWLEGLFG